MLDIKAYSLADLKTLAAEKSIKGRSAMNKADLYAALSDLETAAAKDAQKVSESVQEYYGHGCVDTETDYTLPSYRETLTILGWKRAPRKLKKIWRTLGIIAPAA